MLGVNRRGISNSCFNNATSNMFRIVYSCTGCIKFENQLGGTSVLLQVYIFSQIEGWRYLRALKGLTPNSRNSDNKGLETLKLLCEKPMGMKVLKRRKRAANSYCKATMILFNICELRYVDCRQLKSQLGTHCCIYWLCIQQIFKRLEEDERERRRV